MKEINDRFTFDKLFRELIYNEYSFEEAKEFIMNNYSLSILVFQERIENGFYKNISLCEESKDLMELRNSIYSNFFQNKN